MLKTTSTSKTSVSAPHRCQNSRKAVGTRHGANSVATLVYNYSHRLGQLIVLYSVVGYKGYLHSIVAPSSLIFYPASNKLIHKSLHAPRLGSLMIFFCCQAREVFYSPLVSIYQIWMHI